MYKDAKENFERFKEKYSCSTNDVKHMSKLLFRFNMSEEEAHQEILLRDQLKNEMINDRNTQLKEIFGETPQFRRFKEDKQNNE